MISDAMIVLGWICCQQPGYDTEVTVIFFLDIMDTEWYQRTELEVQA